MAMLASLISGLASGEIVAAVHRARTAAIVYMLAAIAALCGLVFLVGAAYVWVAGRYGPMAACIGFGVGFLVIAGVIVLIHRLSAGARARRRPQLRNADIKVAGIAAAFAVLPLLLKGKGGLGTILGPAIALAAYAIYRENMKPGANVPDDGEAK
jgi:predicted membrane channel-forming protein YqfA (hemolysin III family)